MVPCSSSKRCLGLPGYRLDMFLWKDGHFLTRKCIDWGKSLNMHWLSLWHLPLVNIHWNLQESLLIPRFEISEPSAIAEGTDLHTWICSNTSPLLRSSALRWVSAICVWLCIFPPRTELRKRSQSWRAAPSQFLFYSKCLQWHPHSLSCFYFSKLWKFL